MKRKTIYRCSACGHETGRWLGKCPECESWNTMEERLAPQPPKESAAAKFRPIGSTAKALSDIEDDMQDRVPTGIAELDRTLGGGVVPGSLLLVGGDPGVGKSTLLLQAADSLARAGKRVLYASGEESARQIKLRAKRLGVNSSGVFLLTETSVPDILAQVEPLEPDVLVIDSIQTMSVPDSPSPPGSIAQVKACATELARMAKASGCAVFLIGHVTKEGAIAGPRVLEHMVDAVLYFEGERRLACRVLRAVKNRFGSTQEIGLFEMTERGMEEVANPGELLLSVHTKGVSGSTVYCAMEGTRPMLVDLQALVTRSPLAIPRRTVDGLDAGRVTLLLAVLEKRAGLKLYDQDVFVNVAGGLRVTEPAVDLALCAAVASSLRNAPIRNATAVFGEVGLAGEIRGVAHAEQRLAECVRLGYARVIMPRDSLRRCRVPEGVDAIGADTIADALCAM